MIRAVLEGVCYSQKDGLDIIEAMDVPVASVRLSGGGARSLFWRQMFSDVFHKPVVTLETQEGSAYGAAILAMVGTGQYDNVTDACKDLIHEKERICSQPRESQIYGRAHQLYTALYPTLKPIYRLVDTVS
jgi:xylulokinase